MWEIARAIYTESGYFNLGDMEAACGAQVWGSVAQRVKRGEKAFSSCFLLSFLFSLSPPSYGSWREAGISSGWI